MPTAQQLPADIAEVSEQHAIRIRSEQRDYIDDVNRLLVAIGGQGIPRRVSERINKPLERMHDFPTIGLVLSKYSQEPTQPTASPAMTSPTSASRPPTPAAPQQRTMKRSDWQTIGGGLIALILAIILPTQTSMCTTDSVTGQQFCQTTIYTYDGVSASTAKIILFIIGFAILAWGIYTVRRRWSE